VPSTVDVVFHRDTSLCRRRRAGRPARAGPSPPAPARSPPGDRVRWSPVA